MFGVTRETFDCEDWSMRAEVVFFSVASTMPFVAANAQHSVQSILHLALELTLNA